MTSAPRASDSPGLERLLRPRSVAIVGASPTQGALGASVLENLVRLGFDGEIHLINPNRAEIAGRPCLPSVDALPVGVDVAVLAIPRAAVLDTLRSLAQREVGAAIIFSAGFGEGGAEGLAEQRAIAQIADAHGMVIEGPNCLGLVNYVDEIALTFVETPARALQGRPGVGIVSQSGAMAAVLGVMLTARGLGISYSISTGNEAQRGVEDFVEYLLSDASTRVIALIVEQFREPRRFLALAARAREQEKLLILLHPGKSQAARASAATHTGALAGDHLLMRVKVERAGVLLCEHLEEFADSLELAMRCGVRPSRGTAVLTDSGAFKALTLDLCEELGLALPVLSDEGAPELRQAMPAFVPVSNPLDLTAQALVDPDLYRRTIGALMKDARFGTVVLGIIQTDENTANLKFPPILRTLEVLSPRLAVVFAGLDEGANVPKHYIDALRSQGVPYFPSPERAFRAVARLTEHASRDYAASAPSPAAQLALPEEDGVIPEYRAKRLLGSLGVAFPEGRFVHTQAEALAAAESLGFPVALKAQSRELSHKSDAGGVVLRLRDPQMLVEGFRQLHADVARHRPGLALEGVLVERMGRPGVELIVGGRQDPEWGAIVLVGFGGVQAELVHDVRLLPADLPQEAILRELSRLKSAPLLSGYRGAPALDVSALAKLVSAVAGLLMSTPRISEIDLNPVLVYPEGEGVIALDAILQTRTVSAAL